MLIKSLCILSLLPIIHFSILHAKAPLEKQRELLFKAINENLKLSEKQQSSVINIFKKSHFMSQGNPEATTHPMTKSECTKLLKKNNISYVNRTYEKICKAPYMAPIYNTRTQKVSEATTCIDQFEFPNIPCEYPVVWVRAREAALICQAMGKRLCDTHEWEGACSGSLTDPDYRFDLIKTGMSKSAIHRTLRKAHNRTREVKWSYGNKQNHSLCGTKSTKSNECNTALSSGKGVWSTCGSNTYPVGAFPMCKSSLDVYDIHGNAAEHMNLPFNKKQLTRSGGFGHTEMKGSWFIFSKYSAHKDDCRWRCPDWHGADVMSSHSHRNYHLGFRCCKDI